MCPERRMSSVENFRALWTTKRTPEELCCDLNKITRRIHDHSRSENEKTGRFSAGLRKKGKSKPLNQSPTVCMRLV